MAISETQKQNADLIFLDIRLPAGDGFLVMEQLKGRPAIAGKFPSSSQRARIRRRIRKERRLSRCQSNARTYRRRAQRGNIREADASGGTLC
jgi:CheY-like chemotaxis protein